MPGHEHDQRLIRHEAEHLRQIERDGRIVFAVRYLWWLARYGYQANPYEVQASDFKVAQDATSLSR